MALDRVSSDRIREIRQERKKRSRVHFFVAVISIVIIIVSIVFISRSPQLAVTSVVIRGNYIVPADEVRSLVNSKLDENYLYVLPKRDVFLYPNHAIKYEITNRFPRFETVVVSRTNWNTLLVDVTERKNLYLYCDNLPSSTEIESNCYYVDAHGYIFSRAPTFSGNVYFLFLGNFGWNEGDTPLGKHIASLEIFSQLIRFKEGLQQNNLTPYALRAYPDGSDAFLLSPSLDDSNQKIIFSIEDDIDTEYGNIVSALSADALKNELTKNFDKLQYINLRYGKKVYYKFGQ